MKRYSGLLLAALFNAAICSAQVIIDHNCTDLTLIPSNWVASAKQQLHIMYDHTSHGSQLTSGMGSMVAFIDGGGLGLSYPAGFFEFNNGGTGGALDLHDYATPVGDLGSPNRTAWAGATEDYLDANPDVNVVIWSWCGQVSEATETDINTYLNLMSGLETSYPGVTFVYMTGHLDGSGTNGNLNIRNDQIRDFCRNNGKVLYDFADIESYDPEGMTNYMPLICNDNCDYDSDGNGSRDRNWAIEWQDSHTENADWFSCSAAHSQSLNGNRKAYAAWWLWARIAGWGGPVSDTTPPSTPQNLTAIRVELSEAELRWNASTDPESGIANYLLLRNSAPLATPSATNYIDQTVVPGTTNAYAVIAVNGAGLLSATSGVISVVIPQDTEAPTVPTNVSASTVSATQVNLNWDASTDNAAVAGYRIFRDEVEINISAATDYSDSGLTMNTEYSYSISAYDASGNESTTSMPVVVTTPLVDNEAPSVPQNLSIITTSLTEVVFGWTASTDNVAVAGYRMIRNGSALGTTAATTFTDGSVMQGNTYEYQVSAYDGSSNESATSGVLSVTIPTGTETYYTNLVESTSEVIDTFIFASNPDVNHGNDPYESSIDRFLIRFDLPAEIQNKRIISAELAIFVWNQSNYQSNQFITVHRITNSWTESAATWNQRTGTETWNTPGGDYDTNVIASIEHQEGSENWDHVLYPPADVRYQVQKWVCNAETNNGFMLINDSLTGIGVKASEYSSHGHLEIIWSSEEAPYLYECWQTNYFTAGEYSNPALENTLWGRNADPDIDGLINCFEHALGTDPRSATPDEFLISMGSSVSNQLALNYQRAYNTEGYAFDLLSKETLTNAWNILSSSAYSTSSTNLADGIEQISMDLSTADTNRFYRLLLRSE